MNTSDGGLNHLPVSVTDCHADNLVKQILKLRWIGMETEANKLESEFCERSVRKVLIGELIGIDWQ